LFVDEANDGERSTNNEARRTNNAMNRPAAILLLLFLAACSSSDYDQPPQRPPARGGGGGYGFRPPQASGPLDMLPPAQWWHDPQIAAAVSLSNDQFASLDKLAKEHEDEIARLDRDSVTALRDLRTLLDAETPSQADIVTAAMRVRSIRDSAFERQVQLLAAERTILTRQQWQSLQAAIQSERQERRDGSGYPRGRRGGRGGGRWPGM
jgi:Spy/CpxP family protein refolding chaperone